MHRDVLTSIFDDDLADAAGREKLRSRTTPPASNSLGVKVAGARTRPVNAFTNLGTHRTEYILVGGISARDMILDRNAYGCHLVTEF
jgi:hypothetical protein